MKTEYHILWVDDDLTSVTTERDDLKDYLEDSGIEAIYHLHEAVNGENLHEAILPLLENPELDLIVIDFHMPGTNGRQLINALRASDSIYLPVIFYSQDYEGLLSEAREHRLDGVYLAHRDRLFPRLKEVTASLLKKEQTIRRARGLLMEGLSEIDARFARLSLLGWNKLDRSKKLSILSYLRKTLKEKVDTARKINREAPSSVLRLGKLLAEGKLLSPAYDTMLRWKLLNRILRGAGLNTTNLGILSEMNSRTDNEEPLFRIRNNYAHKTRAELEPNHTATKCTYIRKEMRRHMTNTDQIDRNLQ